MLTLYIRPLLYTLQLSKWMYAVFSTLRETVAVDFYVASDVFPMLRAIIRVISYRMTNLETVCFRDHSLQLRIDENDCRRRFYLYSLLWRRCVIYILFSLQVDRLQLESVVKMRKHVRSLISVMCSYFLVLLIYV